MYDYVRRMLGLQIARRYLVKVHPLPRLWRYSGLFLIKFTMTVSTEAGLSSSIIATLKNRSLSQIGVVLIIVFVGRFLLRGIYRIYLHPLRHFPGPRASAFTRLPYLTATAQGRLYKHVAKLHEKYGEVVRISPDELSFVNPNAWRDIYGLGPKQGQGSPPPKYWLWYGTAAGGVEPISTIQDPSEHARLRKVFLPAFSERALTQQAPLFTKYVDQLVQILKDSSQERKAVDMVRMYNFTTFDIMGDLTFGESLHMLDNAEYDPWVKSIFGFVKRSVQLGLIYTYYPLAAAIVRAMINKKATQLAEDHLEYSSTRVTKRLDKGRASKGVDIWDLVLESEDKGNALTRKEMNSNAGVFMFAGTETTATLLSGLTYLLLSNLESGAMRKLNEEVRGAFASSEDISMETIQTLPYLNACLKEGLRLYPPVPSGMMHRTIGQGSTICGYYVPPEVSVAAHHKVIYSSPVMFNNPLSFTPERWLGDERFASDVRSAFQPFSVGPRDCVGKNMAYHEMRLILAKVVFNFDLELRPESKDWADQQVFILWQKGPLMVNVKPSH
ncbi:cytochrome P450 46A1 [Pyrenochaeta sp. MPI-SDFR-AT-0127]|nr:cytochrome P450 46A1 [Pyrenochaeta sp. MPI-SDFR-AT-0127]